MKNKDQVHYFIIFIIFLALFFRLVFFFLNALGYISLGGQSDADYYDDYATGVAVNAVNLWPVILRWLYEMGIYSREWVSGFLIILSTLMIPLLFDRAFSYKLFCKRCALVWQFLTQLSEMLVSHSLSLNT